MINIIIEFFAVFTIIYLGYLIAIFIKVNNIKKNNKNVTFATPDIILLISVFKLQIDKMNLIGTSLNIGFLNALIIAISYTIIVNIEIDFIFKIILGIILVILLIIIGYYILGKIYQISQKVTK